MFRVVSVMAVMPLSPSTKALPTAAVAIACLSSKMETMKKIRPCTVAEVTKPKQQVRPPVSSFHDGKMREISVERETRPLPHRDVMTSKDIQDEIVQSLEPPGEQQCENEKTISHFLRHFLLPKRFSSTAAPSLRRSGSPVCRHGRSSTPARVLPWKVVNWAAHWST